MNYTDLMLIALPLSKYNDAAVAGISAVPFCLRSKRIGAGITLVIDWKDMTDQGWDADPLFFKKFDKDTRETFINTKDSVRIEFALTSLNKYIEEIVDTDGEMSIERVWSRTSDDFGLFRYMYEQILNPEIFIPWSKSNEYCSQTVIKMAGKQHEKELMKYSSFSPEMAAVYQAKLLQNAAAYLATEG